MARAVKDLDPNSDAFAARDRERQKRIAYISALLGDLERLILRWRLFAFLARRGYDVDEIRAVVDRLVP